MVTVGLAFSPNDSFLYVDLNYNIRKLELNNPDSATARVRVAGIDTSFTVFQKYTFIRAGHDDKLYIGNLAAQSGQMSAISKPNLKGSACEFCPRCLRFPAFHLTPSLALVAVSHPPNMPNYKLGPMTPPCDMQQSVSGMAPQDIIHVYLNPADATLIVEYDKEGVFEINDMLGKVQISRRFTTSGKQSKLTISTAQLPAGIYVYRVTNKNGTITTGKIVITH